MFLSLLPVNVGDDPDRPRPGQRWLGDLYRVHQRLWMAFPDDKRRTQDPFFLGTWDAPAATVSKPARREAGFLFRIERDGCPRILVQSVQRPDWDYAFQNAPYLLSDIVNVREYEPAPRRDDIYRFRLLANVVSRKSEDHPQGKTRRSRPDLVYRRRTERVVRLDPLPDPLPDDPSEQGRIVHARWNPWRAWLSEVGSKCGFRLVEEPKVPLFMAAAPTYVRCPEKGRDESAPKKPGGKRYNGGLFEGMLVCTDEARLRDALINGIGPAKAFGFGLLSLAKVDRP